MQTNSTPRITCDGCGRRYAADGTEGQLVDTLDGVRCERCRHARALLSDITMTEAGYMVAGHLITRRPSAAPSDCQFIITECSRSQQEEGDDEVLFESNDLDACFQAIAEVLADDPEDL